MPWKPSEAKGKTHKAKSPADKKKWAATANAVLEKSGNDGKAIRIANAAVSKGRAKAHGAKKPRAKGKDY
jgi:hypothetical protein